MAMISHPLASGPGWQVRDLVCNSGPGDRPFEEQHEAACIAVVTEGSFQYRTHDGAAVLVPGAVLLGAHGSCYECGHEHVVGRLTPQATRDQVLVAGASLGYAMGWIVDTDTVRNILKQLADRWQEQTFGWGLDGLNGGQPYVT